MTRTETIPRTRATRLDRLLAAARSRHATAGLALTSAVETALIPLPIDLVLLPLVMADRRGAWRLVLAGAVGSLLGALAMYAVGALAFATLGQDLIETWGLGAAAASLETQIAAHGLAALSVAAFTPHVFKIAALLCGAGGMPIAVFAAAVAILRLVRFALIVGVIALFGEGLVRLHARNPWLLGALSVLLVIGSLVALLIAGDRILGA